MEDLGDALEGVNLRVPRSKKRIRFSDAVEVAEFADIDQCNQFRDQYTYNTVTRYRSLPLVQRLPPAETAKPTPSLTFTSSDIDETNSIYKTTRKIKKERPFRLTIPNGNRCNGRERSSSTALLSENALPGLSLRQLRAEADAILSPTGQKPLTLFKCIDHGDNYGNPFSVVHSKYSLPPDVNVALAGLRVAGVTPTSPTARVHAITGTVLVRNLSFQKTVLARWTINDWETYEDVAADFSEHHAQGGYETDATDEFVFKFDVNTDSPAAAPGREGAAHTTTGPLQRSGSITHILQVAVCFVSTHSTPGLPIVTKEYWDNNRGSNYVLVLR